MKKLKVATPDGGKKTVRIHRVGLVTWNGVSGELKIEADDAYLAITKAVASMMLATDQVVNLAIARAEVYPAYGNPNAVQVSMTVVSANAGESKAHDPENMKPWLGALGKFATDNGLVESPE